MAKKLYEETNISAIAAAIRSKNGSQDTYTTAEMADAIEDIETGGILVTKSISENGTYNALLDDDADGYSQVIVNVQSGGGSNVIIGTEIPTASVGDDGDFYLRQRDIPNTITFLEYLQSSGTQYIDTGIYANQDIDLECDYSPEFNGAILGTFTGTSASIITNGLLIYGYDNLNTHYKCCLKFDNAKNYDWWNYKYSVPSTLFNTVLVAKTNTISENDVRSVLFTAFLQHGDAIWLGSFTSTKSILLFACNRTNDIEFGTGKIYRVTIYDKGTIIADYLPCLDSNNVPCMYEAISGTFVYNDGTGDFAYGSEIQTPTARNTLYLKEDGAWVAVANNVEVDASGGGAKNILSGRDMPTSSVGSDGDVYLQYGLPSEYDALDYIQGTGTQYLSVPHKASAVCEARTKINIQSFNNGNSCIFGAAWAVGGFMMSFTPNSSSVRWHTKNAVDSSPISLNTDYTIIANNSGFEIDGNSYQSSPVADPYGYFVTLFFVSNTMAVPNVSPSSMKMYYFKLYDGDSLCHWLIPAKRKIDDVVGMYDICADEFLTNKGTGTFGYGQVISNYDSVVKPYCKVNGAWQNIIGSDIDDVNTSGGGSSLPDLDNIDFGNDPVLPSGKGQTDPQFYENIAEAINYAIEHGGDKPVPGLPASTQSNILASAYADNFVDCDFPWGGFIFDQSKKQYIAKNKYCVNFTNGAFASFDLGEVNYSHVAYIVCSNSDWSNAYPRIYSCRYSRSDQNEPCISSYINRIDFSTYGNTLNAGLNGVSLAAYALCINNETKKMKCYTNGIYIGELAFSNSGQFISISAAIDGGDYSGSSFYYIGVVDGVESDSVIIENLEYLMSVFGIDSEED